MERFCVFLFFEDWKQDLWMKRFVRDHVRCIDELPCAAARVVHALRERGQQRGKGKILSGGAFNTVTRALRQT